MRYIFILLLILSNFSMGQIEIKYDPSMTTPSECVKKGSLIKCPDQDIEGAGHIFSTEKNMIFSYYPKSDGYKEQYAIGRCDSIIADPGLILNYQYNKAKEEQNNAKTVKL